MAAFAKENMFYISIGFWLILGVECGWSNHALTVKTGGSVTIPCLYDEKNPPQKKYWFSEIDKFKIYTNTTEENMSVIDHPDQSLFIVTMRNLQNKHVGPYYCAVETEGKSAVTYELYLKVESDPGVSVVNSSVSGHEGGHVSVQCFYSSGYQKKLKQWCRYKDKSCYRLTDTSQNSSVQISDDGRRSFTVLMTGLRLSDSGWFLCSAGEAMNPVHLTVTEEEPENGARDNPRDRSETGISNNDNETEVTADSQKNEDLLTVWLPVSAALLLLLILVGVFTCRWKQKQDKHQNRERNHSRTTDPIYTNPEDPVIYNAINDESPNDPIKDITYSTIVNAPRSEAKPPAGGTIYSTLAPH